MCLSFTNIKNAVKARWRAEKELYPECQKRIKTIKCGRATALYCFTAYHRVRYRGEEAIIEKK